VTLSAVLVAVTRRWELNTTLHCDLVSCSSDHDQERGDAMELLWCWWRSTCTYPDYTILPYESTVLL